MGKNDKVCHNAQKKICFFLKLIVYYKLVWVRGESMKCIFCGCEESKVLDSRNTDELNAIRRRRECVKCGKRFTTYETIETTPILVIKSDNSRQLFSREKIMNGLVKACEKRPVTSQDMENIVNKVERIVHNHTSQEVKSSEIGEIVMNELKKIDEVAYVRFASVYKRFKDIDNFVDFLHEFENAIKRN